MFCFTSVWSQRISRKGLLPGPLHRLTAESAAGPHGGEARYSWADLSEGATTPTAAESLAQPDTSDLGAEPVEGEVSGGEVAASGAPGEVSEFEDPPRFEALSLLDPVKTEEPEVSAEEIFQELAADPASELSVQAETSLETPIYHLETGSPNLDNNQSFQEGAEVSNTAISDPILESSPSIDPKEGEHPATAEPSADPLFRPRHLILHPCTYNTSVAGRRKTQSFLSPHHLS